MDADRPEQDPRNDASAAPSQRWCKRLSGPSACLGVVTVLTLLDVLGAWRPAALVAVPFLAAYFAHEWRRLMANARILLGVCALLAGVVALRPDVIAILTQAASRMIYLPAFVAVLALLRAAASASDVIASAGRHLVNQPPSRRYLALSFGGHIFGILFNIGGLALLVDMTKRANTLAAAGGEQRVVDWRERRMTSAILRGFAGIVFWSPLGVAFNMLLASIQGLAWADVAPIGIGCTVAFIGLGWLFDRLQSPRGGTAETRREPRGARAVAAVVGHVALVSALTGAAEYALALPFQTVLLIVVPLYGFGWALASRLAAFDPSPLRRTAAVLVDNGIARFPSYANEIAVFAASGFLGVVLVALVPREIVQGFFASLALPPGILAGLLAVSVTVLGFLGVNPLITVAILASAVSSVDIPGLSKTALALALAAGWAPTVVASPLNSSMVMTATLIGRRPWQVAVEWNGVFAATALAITVVLLALLVR